MTLIIIILALASALISSSEIAFFSLPFQRVRLFFQQKNYAKRRVALLLEHPKDLLVTLFLLNTITNVLIQNVASDYFENYSSIWIKVVVPLIVVLLFGELIPKYIGMLYNEKLAISTAPILVFIQSVTYYPQKIITKISSFFSRLFFFFLKPEKPLSKEELEHIVQNAWEKGLLDNEEKDVLLHIVSLEERTIKSIMKNRQDLKFYSIDEPISKLYHLFLHSDYEVIPIINSHKDIIGTVDLTTLFSNKEQLQQSNISQILQKPVYVPEIMTISHFMKQYNFSEKAVFVIDEHRTITGMIRYRDIRNELFTNIEKELHNNIVQISASSYIAKGTISIEELSKILKESLKSKYGSCTLNGWLIEQLDDFGSINQTVRTSKLFFRILEKEPTKIKKVLIQKLR